MNFPVERGVPVPEHWSTGGKGYAEAVYRLQVGESVVLPCKYNASQHWRAKRFVGRRFTSRRIDAGHFRVWRLE